MTRRRRNSGRGFWKSIIWRASRRWCASSPRRECSSGCCSSLLMGARQRDVAEPGERGRGEGRASPLFSRRASAATEKIYAPRREGRSWTVGYGRPEAIANPCQFSRYRPLMSQRNRPAAAARKRPGLSCARVVHGRELTARLARRDPIPCGALLPAERLAIARSSSHPGHHGAVAIDCAERAPRPLTIPADSIRLRMSAYRLPVRG